jgi:hypothetical protein
MTKVTVISLELAAQCWCDEDTSNIEMDSHLANAFAKRLDTKDKRIAELEQGYEELQVATLNAIQVISGGQAKADLRDAYDKATKEQVK